ncbi:hypothetical protein AGMMS49525_05070 [Bacteroidia bacterium]|nr:hypothetical protein AGMMS49525_05070 [Bacteroidia bacterium]
MNMKKTFLVSMMALLSLGGTAFAQTIDPQAMPAISPGVANSTGDVWYHIQTEQRTWGINGSSTTINGGTSKGWYFDQGAGQPLINAEQINVDGARWKFVAVTGGYQIISGLGNEIDYTATAIGSDVKADRFYTVPATNTTTKIFTIVNPNGSYLGLQATWVAAPNLIDKSNNDLGFGTWYANNDGVMISFVEAAPLGSHSLVQPLTGVSFGDVANNQVSKKNLRIVGNGFNTMTFTYNITGPGASAFSVAQKTGALTANSDTLEIEYHPTVAQADTATLTIGEASGALVDPITVQLTGNSDFTFPVQISSYDNSDNHWYYISFTRLDATGKVLTATATPSDTVKQKLLDTTNDGQLWKIAGTWDHYSLISKESDFELRYDYAGTDKRYVTEDPGHGEEFGFVRYNTTDTWQLRNTMTAAAVGNQYFNDHQNRAVTGYSLNDSGNQLTFTPQGSVVTRFVVPDDSVDLGKVWADSVSAEKKYAISIIAGTEGISVSIDGDASAFILNKTSLTALNDTLKVTFAPTVANKNYRATLTLTSSGITKEIILKGSSDLGLPTFSSADTSDENWYYISFKRNGKVLTDKGLNERAERTQPVPGDDDQQWKFVGTKDNLKLVNKSGRELSYIAPGDTLPASGDTFANTVAAGAGKAMYFYQRPDAAWELCFTAFEADSVGLNVNTITDSVYVYYNGDAGNVVLFTPAASASELISPVTFSPANGSADVWYYIQFTRQEANKKVVQDNGSNTNVTQVAQVNGKGTDAQKWKFVGTPDDFLIVSEAGNQFYYASDVDKIQAQDPTTGLFNTFEFVGAPGSWQVAITGARYLNDQAGSTVCDYSAGDAGAYLNFILVTADNIVTAIDEIKGDNNTIDGNVVSTKYYNIQGIEVGKPVTNGVYIQVDLLDTGKVRATKIIHVEP